MGIQGIQTAVRVLIRGAARDVPVETVFTGPKPVLLVHGSQSAKGAAYLQRSLERDGVRVFTHDMDQLRTGDAVKDARIINAEAIRLRLVTGSRTVNVMTDAEFNSAGKIWRERLQAPGAHGVHNSSLLDFANDVVRTEKIRRFTAVD